VQIGALDFPKLEGSQRGSFHLERSPIFDTHSRTITGSSALKHENLLRPEVILAWKAVVSNTSLSNELCEVFDPPSAWLDIGGTEMKKPRLMLAEAILQGSEFGPFEVAGDCKLVTRALQSVGMLPPNLDDYQSYSLEQRRTLGYEDNTLVRLYPWLKQRQVCPWCGEQLDETNIIYHPFLRHVCRKETTLQDQCSWLQEAEEELDPLVSVAIYFKTEDERLRVLWAAQRQKLSLNAFLAAAVRMVLEHRLVLTEFACPDPDPIEKRVA
jgi:hypothetical protein